MNLSLIGLLVLVVVVAIIVWLVEMIPGVAAFSNIIRGIAIIVIVVAALQVLFGVDLLSYTRGIGRR